MVLTHKIRVKGAFSFTRVDPQFCCIFSGDLVYSLFVPGGEPASSYRGTQLSHSFQQKALIPRKQAALHSLQ